MDRREFVAALFASAGITTASPTEAAAARAVDRLAQINVGIVAGAREIDWKTAFYATLYRQPDGTWRVQAPGRERDD
jgi:hypothetical protein